MSKYILLIWKISDDDSDLIDFPIELMKADIATLEIPQDDIIVSGLIDDAELSAIRGI